MISTQLRATHTSTEVGRERRGAALTEGPLPEQALFRGCRCELLEAEGGWTELELGVWLFGGTGK